jgi:hypothetical protein
MPLQRITHAGAATPVGLAGPVTSAALSFSLTASAGYPTGAGGNPFVLVLDPGTPSEEKVLCSSLSGTTVTVAAGGRGWDSTTASAHSAGSTNVAHVFSANEADDANAHIYDPTRNDHTQYARLHLVEPAANYVMTAADVVVLINGSYNVTLPQPSVVGVGATFTIKNISGGTATILPHASEVIEGNASVALSNQTSYILVTDGGNWFILSAYYAPQFQQTTLANNIAGVAGTTAALSLSLSPGTWLVNGGAAVYAGGGAVQVAIIVSTTLGGGVNSLPGGAETIPNTGADTLYVPPTEFSFTATTTVYLNVALTIAATILGISGAPYGVAATTMSAVRIR